MKKPMRAFVRFPIVLTVACLLAFAAWNAGAQAPADALVADQGDAAAQYKAGMQLMRGRRVFRADIEAGMALVLKAAQLGYTPAELEIGVYNVRALRNYGEGLRWLRKAAEKLDERAGVAAAEFLGSLHVEGFVVQRDYAEAARWYRKAAERGHSTAALSLHWIELETGGLEKFDKSIEPFRKLAKEKNARARYSLVFIYAEGIQTKPNAREAAYWLMEGPASSDAEAAYRLGVFYESGFISRMSMSDPEGVNTVLMHAGVHMSVTDPDTPVEQVGKARAVGWYRKGAEGGHIGAQVNLAKMYFDSESPYWNCAEAVKWTKVAADKGDATALFNMGQFYMKGPDRSKVLIGIKGDDTRQGINVHEVTRDGAASRAGMRAGDLILQVDGLSTLPPPPRQVRDPEQFRKDLAEPPPHINMEGLTKKVQSGNAKPIQFNVRREGVDGLLSIAVTPEEIFRKCPGGEESGLRIDPAEAVKWFERAGEKGETEALYLTARAYREGKGVPKDPRKAMDLYQKSAGLGDWQAAQEISRMYSNGEGVEKNKDLSESWFRKAVQLRHRR
jgi:TPR repeat protein